MHTKRSKELIDSMVRKVEKLCDEVHAIQQVAEKEHKLSPDRETELMQIWPKVVEVTYTDDESEEKSDRSIQIYQNNSGLWLYVDGERNAYQIKKVHYEAQAWQGGLMCFALSDCVPSERYFWMSSKDGDFKIFAHLMERHDVKSYQKVVGLRSAPINPYVVKEKRQALPTENYK